jgi:hypothetical protein
MCRYCRSEVPLSVSATFCSSGGVILSPSLVAKCRGSWGTQRKMHMLCELFWSFGSSFWCISALAICGNLINAFSPSFPPGGEPLPLTCSDGGRLTPGHQTYTEGHTATQWPPSELRHLWLPQGPQGTVVCPITHLMGVPTCNKIPLSMPFVIC